MSSRSPRERPSPGGDRQIVFGGEFDRFLAADNRHPDRRMRPLQWPRPDRDVLVRPEFAVMRENLLGPRLADNLECFLEAGARLGQRHIVHLVFARNAASKAGNQPAIGNAVQHRQLFGQSQRLVQWQQVAVDQQLQPLGALRRCSRQQVRRVHQSVRRAMVLIEPDAVIAEPVEFLPRLEMFDIGARGDLRVAVFLRQFVGDFQVFELLTVSQEIEYEDFHRVASRRIHGFVTPARAGAHGQHRSRSSSGKRITLPGWRPPSDGKACVSGPCCDNQKIDKPAITECSRDAAL
jgi:hypothetical protein